MTRLSKIEFVEALKISGVVYLVINVILFIFALYPPLWEIPWTVVFAFIVFEALMAIFIGGGSGLFLIKQHKLGNRVLIKQRALAKGHAFLVLFVMILIATFVSIAMTDIALWELNTYLFPIDYWHGLAGEEFWNLVVTVFLFGYLNREFYRKKQPLHA